MMMPELYQKHDTHTNKHTLGVCVCVVVALMDFGTQHSGTQDIIRTAFTDKWMISEKSNPYIRKSIIE